MKQYTRSSFGISLGLVALAVTIGSAKASQLARATAARQQSAQATPSVLAPVDPQKVEDQQDMTWADYHPIPGHNWADTTLKPTKRQYKIALIAVDFSDQPFVITMKKKSDLFGNPQIDPVPRADVAKFYANFYNTPSAVNHGHTINGYWMEQSRGQIGIAKLVPYGPYKMPKKLFQYGLNEYGQASAVPTGYVADGNIERDADALWKADAGNDVASKYDVVIRIYAGYDETSVWQEFGEMKFQTKEDIPKAWGNPDTTKARWVVTRYEPWTSWAAGAQQWGLSSVRQGESSGTLTHELSHHLFSVGDNNNNPYAQPFHRAGSGPWDIMDRGSFNGPGGWHNRWLVPAIAGASMPAGHTLRNKIKFKFLADSEVLRLNRDGVAKSGLVVADVTARALAPKPGQFAGITVRLDGPTPQDRTPRDNADENPLSAGDPVYNFYTLEVVQRIGYDSFTPDNGVLIAKNKDGEGSSFTGANGQRSRTSFGIFTWVIDAHPEDINMIDFKRPNGEPVMRSVADSRQLNDALFHAGTNSGSKAEWEDSYNRLHFYVIDLHKDADGVRSYTLGVRSLDGSGPQTRDVALTAPAAQSTQGTLTTCAFTLKNTGAAATTDSTAHPQNVSAYVNDDIYRLKAWALGAGWSAQLKNTFAAVKFGEAQQVPVYITRSSGSAATAMVTLKAQSESDSTKMTTATCKVSAK